MLSLPAQILVQLVTCVLSGALSLFGIVYGCLVIHKSKTVVESDVGFLFVFLGIFALILLLNFGLK